MFDLLKKVETYSKDGRASLYSLYNRYLQLKEKYNWTLKVIYTQTIPTKEKGLPKIPVISLLTKKKGVSVWLTSGIHGEEPTGPNAIARNIDVLGKLSKKGIPIVLTPLCNPSGYIRNWRYPNEYRDWKKGKSVGDSEYLLPDVKSQNKVRAENPSCYEAKELTQHILSTIKDYPPLLTIDLHEDEKLKESYIYSQGKLGTNDKIAREIVSILQKSGIPLQMKGETRFDEKITDGVVSNINDGSIDELLSSEKIIINGKLVKGPKAKTVIVVETPTIGVSLERRITAHNMVIQSLENFFLIASLQA